MPLAPAKIELVGNALAILWNDGRESFLPLEKMRRACPCAACGGEPDVMGHVIRPEVHYKDSSFTLRGWNLIGGYALQPTWADGHGTGLYSYPLLRTLAE